MLTLDPSWTGSYIEKYGSTVVREERQKSKTKSVSSYGSNVPSAPSQISDTTPEAGKSLGILKTSLKPLRQSLIDGNKGIKSAKWGEI